MGPEIKTDRVPIDRFRTEGGTVETYDGIDPDDSFVRTGLHINFSTRTIVYNGDIVGVEEDPETGEKYIVANIWESSMYPDTLPPREYWGLKVRCIRRGAEVWKECLVPPPGADMSKRHMHIDNCYINVFTPDQNTADTIK